jgi:hypothetical protein
MNRLMRRMQQFGNSFSAKRSHGETADTSAHLEDASRPPDVASARAKSSGHGKKTADKWNQ